MIYKYLIPIVGVIIVIALIGVVYYLKTRTRHASLPKFLQKQHVRWLKLNPHKEIKGRATNDVTIKVYANVKGEFYNFQMRDKQAQVNTILHYSFLDHTTHKSNWVQWEAQPPTKVGQIAVTNKNLLVRQKNRRDVAIFYYQIENIIFTIFKLKKVIIIHLKNQESMVLSVDNHDFYYLIWYHWKHYSQKKI